MLLHNFIYSPFIIMIIITIILIYHPNCSWLFKILIFFQIFLCFLKFFNSYIFHILLNFKFMKKDILFLRMRILLFEIFIILLFAMIFLQDNTSCFINIISFLFFEFFYFLNSRPFFKLHILIQIIELLFNSFLSNLFFVEFIDIREGNEPSFIYCIFVNVFIMDIQLFFFLII